MARTILNVNTVSSYGLDGQGLISGIGKRFFVAATSRLVMGSTQSPIKWVQGVLRLS